MVKQNLHHRVVIIGAGPVGLELGALLESAGIDYLLIEAGQLGSTISWFAPQTTFFSSPERIALNGVPITNDSQQKTTREEYLSYLRAFAAQFALKILPYTEVTKIESLNSGFELTTVPSQAGIGEPTRSASSNGERKTLRADKVVLAIGDMHRPHRLNIPGEELPHISHYFLEPHQYFNTRVMIVGGGNSAVEAALRLYRVGADVTMSYRGEFFNAKKIKFWLFPEIRSLIKRKEIGFYPYTEPAKITETEVSLNSTRTNKKQQVAADFVFLLTGYEQKKDLFQSLGVRLEGDEQKPMLDTDTMETNVPGVYVAGTAVAGTQLGGVKEYIETSHIHVWRIRNHLLNEAPPEEEPLPGTGIAES